MADDRIDVTTVLFALLLAAMSLPLSAYAETVSLWHAYRGAEREALEGAIRRINEEHSDLVHKNILLAAWVQVGGGMVAGVAGLAGLLWLRRRRRLRASRVA